MANSDRRRNEGDDSSKTPGKLERVGQKVDQPRTRLRQRTVSRAAMLTIGEALDAVIKEAAPLAPEARFSRTGARLRAR